jgi:predicted membrane metal-binding protein
MRGGLHENLESRTTDGPGSERGFAIVFAVVFVLVGLWPLLSGGLVRAWALLIAAAFLLAGFAAPGILAPLNRLWFRFGMALGRIVSPIVMGVIFFGTVMPTGLVMRLFRKDLLRLRFDPAAESYWIPRDPPGPSAESLKQQF